MFGGKRKAHNMLLCPSEYRTGQGRNATLAHMVQGFITHAWFGAPVVFRFGLFSCVASLSVPAGFPE
jgi:D-aminopeptidase